MPAEIWPETQAIAMYIGAVVRNAMEDFHCKHLSDAQMKELNPIIRNAVFTALCALDRFESSKRARGFVEFNNASIPDYWEKCRLIEKI
jgi:hypothetical protein